ncbi:MAG: hypothetical protein M3O31_14690 [Acidobacteriota bacterium]|nr:hypothetical protein [Acidobacteriota bacterium]
MTRLNTILEREGAESFVLGNLRIRGISAQKPESENGDYDLITDGPDAHRQARIRVTTRWRTGAKGFICAKFECDFLVVAFLNRGTKDGTGETSAPQFYVIPIDVISETPEAQNGNKLYISNIPKSEDYLDAWHLISSFTQSR